MANMQPASRIEAFQVTTPAGTAKASPLVTDLGLDVGQVLHVDIEIPPGHAGLTGIQLRIAGGQVIPLTPGTYLVGDGRTFEWNLTDQLDSGAWQAYTYNTDIYDHSHNVTFSILDFGSAGVAGANLPLTATPQLV